MDRQNVGLGAVFLALLGFTAINSSILAGAPQNSALVKGSAQPYFSAASASTEKANVQSMIAKLLDVVPTSGNTPRNSSGKCCARVAYRMQYLVATLPEPSAPPLRYAFDTALDAIVQALGSEGFVYDSSQIFWAPRSSDKSQKFNLGSDIEFEEDSSRVSNGRSSNGRGAQQRWRLESREGDANRTAESEPGVVVFRRIKPCNPELLVLFLVGETPTGGIRKASLHRAFDWIAYLSRWWANSRVEWPDSVPPQSFPNPADGAMHKVRILGPFYSASADSLRIAIHGWQENSPSVDPLPQFNVISGSANAVEDDEFDADPLINFRITTVPARAKFSVRSSSRPMNRIELLLEELGIEPGRIALLIEEGANYNEQFWKVNAQCGGDKRAARASVAPMRKFYFPQHIAALRRLRSEGNPINSLASGPGPKDISIPLEDTEDAYTIQPFSPRAESSSEQVLERTFSAIRRAKIPYVGIASSDVEDTIFLAQQIVENCPNVTPFVFSSDLFYLHSDVNNDLQGMLVFSAYPLFDENQLWTYPYDAGGHREFANDAAEGDYNAALALLNDDQQPPKDRPRQDDSADTAAAELIEYGGPLDDSNSQKTPGLWLSVVGRRSLWPVHYYPPSKEEKARYVFAVTRKSVISEDSRHETNLYERIYPGYFVGGFGLLTVSCIGIALLVGNSFKWSPSAPDPEKANPGQSSANIGFIRILVPSTNSRLGRALDRIWSLRGQVPVSISRYLGPPVSPRFRAEKSAYVASLIIGIATAYLIAAGFFYLPRKFDGLRFGPLSFADGAPWFLGRFSFVCALIFFGLITFIAFSALQRTLRQSVIKPGLISLIAALSSFTLAVWLVSAEWWNLQVIDSLALSIRASRMRSGVSPLSPILFLGVASLCLILSHIRRNVLLDESRIDLPYFGFTGDSFKGVDNIEQQVGGYLACASISLPGSVPLLAGLLVAFCYFFWPSSQEALVDGLPLKGFILVCAFFVCSILSLTLLRFALVWVALRRLLRRLYWHPTRTAYAKFRIKSQAKELATVQTVKLNEPLPSYTALEAGLVFARQLCSAATVTANPTSENQWIRKWRHYTSGTELGRTTTVEIAKDKPEHSVWRLVPAKDRLVCLTSICEGFLSECLENQSSGRWREESIARHWTRWGIVQLSRTISEIFEPAWRDKLLGKPSKNDAKLLEAGNFFLVTRLVDFMRQVFPQLMNLATLSTAGLIALVLAVSSYAFPQREDLLYLTWILLIADVAVVISVFISINRDRIVSILSGTTPGKLNWNSAFVGHLFLYGLIPILSLLGAQFPHTFGQIAAWFGSLFSSVNH